MRFNFLLIFAMLTLVNCSGFAEPIDNLEPASFWREFFTVSSIYRPSKGEQKIATHIVEEAEKSGFTSHIDQSGNVLIKIPAKPGCEKITGVVLQSHLDMVCITRPGEKFNWGEDQIEQIIKDGWLHAKKTTLGADNGVGVAVMLDFMKNLPERHGPVELLFTTDEEGDFSGVCGLQPGFIKGSILLNLDSEEAGEFNVGCAGGQADILELALNHEDCRELQAFKISFKNGQSGHSGVDVHRGRANAIKELFKAIRYLGNEVKIRLASGEGGVTDTAIPGEAWVIICYNPDDQKTVERSIEKASQILKKRFAENDPEIMLNLEKVECPETALNYAQTQKICRIIDAVPSGILAMSRKWPGNVQTSMNPGVFNLDRKIFRLISHLQASSLEVIAMLSRRVKEIAMTNGADHLVGEPYRPWEPNQSQEFLDRAVALHQRLTGKKPVLKVVHAGVECGELKNIYPHLQMLSFGPDIRHAHTPDEKLSLVTINDFIGLVRALTMELPRVQ
ncbi:MAG: beta-Ala-His dipeptidase [Candidatus Rifleibacteriota bacterium]